MLEIVIVGLIRISPCRRGCYEPLDSTQPDTQGRGLNPHLDVGERIRVLAPVIQFRPSIDGIAITNNRILGFSSYAMPGKRPAISIPLGDVEGIDYEGKLSGIEFAGLLTWFLALEDPGVALFTPFADQ